MEFGMNHSQMDSFAWSALLLLSMPFSLVTVLGLQVYRTVSPDGFERMRERVRAFGLTLVSMAQIALSLALLLWALYWLAMALGMVVIMVGAQ